METAPNGKVTARHVSKVANQFIKPKQTGQGANTWQRNPSVQTFPVSDAMQIVDIIISQLERISVDDPRRAEAFGEVRSWIDEHK